MHQLVEPEQLRLLTGLCALPSLHRPLREPRHLPLHSAISLTIQRSQTVLPVYRHRSARRSHVRPAPPRLVRGPVRSRYWRARRHHRIVRLCHAARAHGLVQRRQHAPRVQGRLARRARGEGGFHPDDAVRPSRARVARLALGRREQPWAKETRRRGVGLEGPLDPPRHHRRRRWRRDLVPLLPRRGTRQRRRRQELAQPVRAALVVIFELFLSSRRRRGERTRQPEGRCRDQRHRG